MSDMDVEYVLETEKEEEKAKGIGIISDEEELKVVVNMLCEKYQTAVSNRSAKLQLWNKWRRQFEGRPNNKARNLRYPNASRIVPPLATIIGQGVFGYFKQIYSAVKPPWYVEPLRKDDSELVEQCSAISRYLNILSESRLDLNLEQFSTDFLQEVGVMGTCGVFVPWSTQPWNFKTSDNGSEVQVNATFHDGPELIITPIEDLVYPENWKDLQKMPWVARDYPIADYQMRNMASDGLFDGASVEEILKSKGNVITEKEENQNQMLDSEPDRTDETILTDFYFFYDADKDGVYEDLIFTVHVPSKTVLSQRYNEFGYRMLAVGRFISRTYSLEGRGSGQICEHPQDEIEALHNLRNDNMKFSNMRMLATRRNIFKGDESIYPGKIIESDNPKEDIVPIQLGEVYPSSLQAENQTMAYAREASGMLSTMMGAADPTLGSRDTWRGQSMRTARSAGLFTSVAEGLHSFWNELGMMIFFQLVKHKDRVIANETASKRLSEKEIKALSNALNINMSEIPMKMAFRIRTSDPDQTFDVKRQSILTLTQIYAQYSQQTFPLVMQLFGPQGQQLKKIAPDAWNHMLSLYTGSTKLVSEVFKFFGEEDSSKYVPDTRKFEMLQDMLKEMTTSLLEQQERAKALKGNGMQGLIEAPGSRPIGIEEQGVSLEYEEQERGGLVPPAMQETGGM